MLKLNCNHNNKIESMLESIEISKDENEYVVMTGWLERCSDCKALLGEGYGDADFYPNWKLAKEAQEKMAIKIGIWE